MPDVPTLVGVLWRRRGLRGHERWTRAELRNAQQKRLDQLRTFARDRSEFYRRRFRGLENAPLDQLPVLTKSDLMEHFDELSTVRDVRLTDVVDYLERTRGNARFRGRYVVSATSGSTGRRCIIVNDRREWTSIIASYARANEWAGIRAGLTRRVSMSVVSSTTIWHQSARVAATVQSPLVRSERIGAAAPLPQIVARLNERQPQVLVGYASMIRALAEEQLAGWLHITPHAVNSASEVLTDQARTLAENAWHVHPFDVYAATETGGIAAECAHHHGMHLFEDLVIAEVVDDRYRPVPPGQTGERLLVTVLDSRTLPLIRYELTDRVRTSIQRCPCALPFRLLTAIEGRTSDILLLPNGSGGSTRIHPVLFHRVLDLVDARGWQVRQRPTGLDVLVADPDQRFDAHAIERSLVAALTDADASAASVRVSRVDEIPAGPAGKRPLVVAEAHPSS